MANGQNPEWLDGLNRRLSFAVLLRNLKLLEGSHFTRLKMYSNVVNSTLNPHLQRWSKEVRLVMAVTGYLSYSMTVEARLCVPLL
jgi:hypothetical protein